MPPNRGVIRRLGLDLDNTVVDYSMSYAALAPKFGIPSHEATRSVVRSKLRQAPNNDEEWQRFQALLYTDGLSLAEPASGLRSFLETCRTVGVATCVISHKTERGPARFGGNDLRTPAMTWLHDHNLVPTLLSVDQVHFTESLEAKVDVISASKLDVFVDDLLEVLAHKNWPSKTQGILYSPGDWHLSDGRWSVGFPSLTAWIQS